MQPRLKKNVHEWCGQRGKNSLIVFEHCHGHAQARLFYPGVSFLAVEAFTFGRGKSGRMQAGALHSEAIKKTAEGDKRVRCLKGLLTFAVKKGLLTCGVKKKMPSRVPACGLWAFLVVMSGRKAAALAASRCGA